MSARSAHARATTSAPRPHDRRSVTTAPRTRPSTHAPLRRVRRTSNAPRWLVLIPLVAVLLLGIVWINVSTLAFVRESGRVADQARDLEVRNMRMKAQLDRINATVIERAQEKLGMEIPSNEAVTPLDIPKR